MTPLSKTHTRPEAIESAPGTYPCPGCDHRGLRVFHERHRVPIHSCRMVDTQQEAVAYPCRPLALGLCQVCGFISNVLFDPEVMHYDRHYEDRQGYSPRFRAYLNSLVEHLVARYDLRGRDILEIGCGPGDFLRELCHAGRNRGIGIDPRCAAHAEGDLRFVGEPLRETHAELPMDFVCCRHTLEHIPETLSFVRLLRRVIGDRMNTLVFFEVPDTSRILHERAFWDVYYEHCSYFTQESLATLFEGCGFDVVDASHAFDDQYLLLVARPVHELREPSRMEKADGARMVRQANAFAHDVEKAIRSWRERIERWRQQGRRIAIWGAGSKCVAFLTGTGSADAIASVVDINPHHQGRFLPGIGHRIASPASLVRQKPDVVIVMNRIYHDEINEQLTEMGIPARTFCV